MNQEFKEGLTPLMLKFIEAHECQCPSCNPEFADGIREQANLKARDAYERSILEKAQEQLYAAAIEKYKSKAEALALHGTTGSMATSLHYLRLECRKDGPHLDATKSV